MHRLLDVTPRAGWHPSEAVLEVADEVGKVVGDGLWSLHRRQFTMPDRALLTEAIDALAQHTLHQLAVRQFSTPADDGAGGTTPDLVEIVTRFHSLDTRILGPGFDVVVHLLARYPLERWLEITSEAMPIGIAVTTDFTLSVDWSIDRPIE